MKQTMAQKVYEATAQNAIHNERMVKVDRVFCHEVTTPGAIRMLRDAGMEKPFDKNKVAAILDHVSPSKDSASAQQAKVLREWTKEQGVRFFDVGNNGVCHVVFAEEGMVEPGMVVVMGDSHTCTHGAFGAMAFGVGTTELAGAMARGYVAMQEPRSIRVELKGKRKTGVEAKDVALEVVRVIGHAGATDCVLEFVGEVVADMEMEERMTLCNMAVECGATTGMCPVDAKTVRYLQDVGVDVSEERQRQWMQTNADAEALYERSVPIDVSDMEPVVTLGNHPDQVVPWKAAPHTKVNQVWVGSCTNGRITDLRNAAKVIQGKRVADGVRAIVSPASTRIWKQAMREGLWEIFAEAGFCITSPGCGACMGMGGGVLAPGEVCASTSNRNFNGRMGKGGQVHLMSAASAAQTAVQGYFGMEEVCG